MEFIKRVFISMDANVIILLTFFPLLILTEISIESFFCLLFLNISLSISDFSIVTFKSCFLKSYKKYTIIRNVAELRYELV